MAPDLPNFGVRSVPALCVWRIVDFCTLSAAVALGGSNRAFLRVVSDSRRWVKELAAGFPREAEALGPLDPSGILTARACELIRQERTSAAASLDPPPPAQLRAICAPLANRSLLVSHVVRELAAGGLWISVLARLRAERRGAIFGVGRIPPEQLTGQPADSDNASCTPRPAPPAPTFLPPIAETLGADGVVASILARQARGLPVGDRILPARTKRKMKKLDAGRSAWAAWGVELGAFKIPKLGKKKREERSVVMVGPAQTGKTSLLYRLKLGENVTTNPTIGFNVESIAGIKFRPHRTPAGDTPPVQTGDVTVWDIGGQSRIRPLWRHYMDPGKNMGKSLVFVVNAAGCAAYMADARQCFWHDMVAAIPHRAPFALLVVATHMDHPLARAPPAVAAELGLHELPGAAVDARGRHGVSGAPKPGDSWACPFSSWAVVGVDQDSRGLNEVAARMAAFQAAEIDTI